MKGGQINNRQDCYEEVYSGHRYFICEPLNNAHGELPKYSRKGNNVGIVKIRDRLKDCVRAKISKITSCDGQNREQEYDRCY